MNQAFDPSREEIFEIQGDYSPEDIYAKDVYRTGQHVDPEGTGLIGQASHMKLQETALGHPLVRYKDMVLEVDVYKDPSSSQFMVNLFCPRCRHSLRITSERKQIAFEPALTKDQATGKVMKRGTLSVSPFKCTWELGRDTEGTNNDRMDFGVGLCGWTVAIDNNVAKDA